MPNAGLVSGAPSRKDFGLTPMERQAISLTVSGYSSEESAIRIGISEQAFSQKLVAIFEKLNVSNCFELVLFAHYYDLIDVSPSGQTNDPRPEIQTGLPGI